MPVTRTVCECVLSQMAELTVATKSTAVTNNRTICSEIVHEHTDTHTHRLTGYETQDKMKINQKFKQMYAIHASRPLRVGFEFCLHLILKSRGKSSLISAVNILKQNYLFSGHS